MTFLKKIFQDSSLIKNEKRKLSNKGEIIERSAWVSTLLKFLGIYKI